LADGAEHFRNLGLVLHIARQKQIGIEGIHQVLHLTFHFALFVGQVGDAEVGPGGMELLGNAPGDRSIVGDARYQGVFPSQV
jgi:hypothetical protein